jgi:hypothetical protein
MATFTVEAQTGELDEAAGWTAITPLVAVPADSAEDAALFLARVISNHLHAAANWRIVVWSGRYRRPVQPGDVHRDSDDEFYADALGPRLAPPPP